MRRTCAHQNGDPAMSSLEQRQRGLLDLMKGRGGAPCDPYLQRIANSRELTMLRKIAHWWNEVSLAAQCRLTARLLKKLGCFDAVVRPADPRHFAIRARAS